MTLTNTAIRNADPGKKPVKLFDGGGLFLLINPNGSRWWRLKYRFDRSEKLLSLGVYPDVGLKDARERRDEARKLIAGGIDPGAARKAQKTSRLDRAANSVETVAKEWFEKFATNWAPTYSSKVIARFEKDIYPWIGDRPVAEVSPREILEVLRRIEKRGALETAHRALSECSQLFRYAVATGRADSDPTRDLKGALATPAVRHMASITDPAKVGELMRAIDGYSGFPVSQAALKLAPLLFVRPGELRKAEWAEFDLEGATWTIPAARMKTRKQNPQDHIVPLATQALAVVRELHRLTGQSRYVFPGVRTHERPMSENTVNAALRRMGYQKDEMTGHGFRAMARTILDEHLGFRPDVVEQQLAHAVRDPQGRAYNRTAHLAERRRMMQAWADYLNGLAAGGQVVPIRAKAS
jgi:integrase